MEKSIPVSSFKKLLIEQIDHYLWAQKGFEGSAFHQKMQGKIDQNRLILNILDIYNTDVKSEKAIA